jgi:hypothetical protein
LATAALAYGAGIDLTWTRPPVADVASLRLYRGDTATRRFRWLAGGAPVDLTGASARFTVRARPADATALYLATTGNGLVTLTPATGEISVSVPVGDWPPAVYDLEITLAGGQVRTLAAGRVTVQPDVSRP